MRKHVPVPKATSSAAIGQGYSSYLPRSGSSSHNTERPDTATLRDTPDPTAAKPRRALKSSQRPGTQKPPHFYDICGVNVSFPFKAYPCQLDYMKTVMSALQKGANALIESPTGTGKTLCLLCCVLAWREAYAAKLQLDYRLSSESEVNLDPSASFSVGLSEKLAAADSHQSSAASTSDRTDARRSEEVRTSPPTIYYASRTHSQISQVVGELNNTSYKPNVCILGSRDQLCVHSKVRERKSNAAMTHACRSLVKNSRCSFYSKVPAISQSDEYTQAVMDIEDIVTFGVEKGCCPFYLTRSSLATAHLVLLPYNYLIDPVMRAGSKLDLSNSIVIFDEAHNLESFCEEAMSFDLKISDLGTAVEEMKGCIDFSRNHVHDMSLSENEMEDCIEKISRLRDILVEYRFPSQKEWVPETMDFMYRTLASVQITEENAMQFIQRLDEAVQIYFLDPKNSRQSTLKRLHDALGILFSREGKEKGRVLSEYYRVVMRQEITSVIKENQFNNWYSKPTAVANTTMSYWCFGPSLAIREIMSRGVRSLLLTSGTLAPMKSFAAELGVPFEFQLENPHIIDSSQIWVGNLKRGPTNVQLNSSFKSRDGLEYQIELGNVVAGFSRTVPDGMLVFFPSYAVMSKVVDIWRQRGNGARSIWDRISESKAIFVEPRDKSDLPEVMESYFAQINQPGSVGAVLFAVCRGKVSEGIDFGDHKARAVIITGLPFPPLMEPKVVMKKIYLDEQIKAHAGNRNPSVQTLSGNEWYKQQASRAVNQAIGRVIRHRADFGAIMLCDERFGYAEARRQLPVWVRPFVSTCSDYSTVQTQLVEFFKKNAVAFPAERSDKSAPTLAILEDTPLAKDSRFLLSSNVTPLKVAPSHQAARATHIPLHNNYPQTPNPRRQSISCSPAEHTTTSRQLVTFDVVGNERNIYVKKLPFTSASSSSSSSLSSTRESLAEMTATTKVAKTPRATPVSGVKTALADRLKADERVAIFHRATELAEREQAQHHQQSQGQALSHPRPQKPSSSFKTPLAHGLVSPESCPAALKNVTSKKAQSPETPAVPDPEVARAYLAQIKAALGTEKYGQFGIALKSFRNGSADLKSLHVTLHALFSQLSDDALQMRLLQEFIQFVPVSQRKNFLALQEAASKTLPVFTQTVSASAKFSGALTDYDSNPAKTKQKIESHQNSCAAVLKSGETGRILLESNENIIDSSRRRRRQGSLVEESSSLLAGKSEAGVINDVGDDAVNGVDDAVFPAKKQRTISPRDNNDSGKGDDSEEGGRTRMEKSSVPCCPVCLDPMMGREARSGGSESEWYVSVRCGHACCHGCWLSWLENRLECPVCRTRTRVKFLVPLNKA